MYTIIEVANTHGGDINYLNSLIEEFEIITENVGIKFQPFKYDKIALKDFEWYPVYEKLFFNEKQWSEIIEKANSTKDVWLDLFDVYGVDIVQNNLSKIVGIKLQTSVLNNYTVLNRLKELNLKDKKLIINVAGRELDNIEAIVTYFETNFKLEELLIEVGFQAYPTDLVDSGISKIQTVKQKFKKRVVFADHVSGKEIHAKILPIMAALSGVDVIEKHVMHSSLPTEYDHFSSIKADEFKELIEFLNSYTGLLKQPFINKNEMEYLRKSMQIPVLNSDKKKGDIVSLSDFDYKRTDQKGLGYYDLKEGLKDGKIVLTTDKKADELVESSDFKKVKVACIIAARLKSSRLKDKGKLKIGNLSSVELCIKNCLRIKNVDVTILATSPTEQDSELKNHTYHPSVIFHTGDPDDVIQRYLDIIRKEKIDVFIRVTGDMPYVSADIAEYLLKEHFLSGADYTIATKFAVGTSVEIINTKALEKVKDYFPSANYSEYMSWYFQNNPKHFSLNFIDLPEKWVRDYRLTIDYQEDLDMFNKIDDYFEIEKLDFSIDTLYNFLDNNPDVAKINSHITLTYKTDQKLIDTLNKYTKIPD